MMRTASFLSFLFAMMVIGFSAHAACGGGGYHPKQADGAVVPAVYTESTVRQIPGEILIRRLSTAEFDSIKGKLNLSEKQSGEIQALVADIKHKGDDAITQAKSYDGKQDFEARLPGILTPEQVKLYQGAKVAHR
ncbi:MAG TPA: hypothetical protein VKX17_10470 [Planctomycetota bacterium]|nr:hypothetical protein [Planctomycetota bacterium]